MSIHCGYIVKVIQLKPHSNADKLQIATFFGNDTCVSLEVHENDIGIYFPSDLQLSEEYCEVNHLCRKKKDGTPDTGYLEENKRNIRTIKLRGERSDGIYMPLDSLAYTGVDLTTLKVGDTITEINGHPICCKYIPRSNAPKTHEGGNRVRKHKDPIAPLFLEHADTEQLAYNLSAFRPGDEIEITLKVHGTSQRTAYLPVLTGYKRSLWDKIFRRPGSPIYDWGYADGTRRVILDSFDGGFYGSNEFRKPHADYFKGKLWKGETVYYEVAGFTHTGAPIMAACDNKKLNDKDFVKKYGTETVFSYGCSPTGIMEHGGIITTNVDTTLNFDLNPQSRIFVYRMTMTNEDGEVVEYTPDFMRYRCEQMGVDYVPVFFQGFIEAVEINGKTQYRLIGKNNLDIVGDESAGSVVQTMAELFYDGTDPIGKTHVREGVVVRIINRPKFTAYKHKNHTFKMLSGIAIEQAENNGTTDSMDADILSEM